MRARPILAPLCALLLDCGAGASASSVRFDPNAPAIAREGASSGSLSRIDEPNAPLPLTAPGDTPPPAFPSPGAGNGRGTHSGATLPIAFGQTVSGRLEPGDTPLDDGSVADDYVFVGSAGEPIVAEMHGGQLLNQPGSHMDSYLYLLLDGREVTHDDDSAGNLDSRIEVRLPTTGVYTLRATTYGSGLHAGEYTLTLRRAR